MAVITAKALAVLVDAIDHSTEMIHLHLKDPTGHRYAGRVASMLAAEHRQTVDVECEDGEVLFGIPLNRIQKIDVRPRQEYPLMTVIEFVDGALPEG